ncbi:hypothetical protein TVAG_116220 [Trichomonas vaginalis G3]|uniref:Pecanex C-terminal domain-containing protein n=1 Tax=Trichomonas vaginalis (strain ATCC PRA-98 / G3) TaxID=412133 RepID=A2EXQ8_TRIV3|nr:pecanex family [Trichomonas vaginalis G3]EAY02568.1 hypothetical protein TVAG_116220 [Trichomonas vaginalis G3]KAI5552041.1 pecanex family [Trichomonas vaginalis G3]|eukprot:XP_001330704.1 hypothetical protein [Trichomonas vaginalis G3]
MHLFIEIISRDSYCVNFRISGLEYTNETICHTSERNTLTDTRLSFEDSISENTSQSFISLQCSFRFLANKIPLDTIEVNKYSYQSWFSGISQEDLKRCFLLTLSLVLRDYGIFEIVENQQEFVNDDLRVLSTIGAKFSVDDQMKIQKIIDIINHSIAEGFSIRVNKIICLFSETNHYEIEDDVDIDIDRFDLENILSSFTRRYLAVTCGVVLGYSTDIAYIDELFVAIPANSPEFEDSFKNFQKYIVTIQSNEYLLIFKNCNSHWNFFSYNSYAARSLWQSEATSCLYFQNDNQERNSIQSNHFHLNNLVIQACNQPIGYPAYVSPVLTSYAHPHEIKVFY